MIKFVSNTEQKSSKFPHQRLATTGLAEDLQIVLRVSEIIAHVNFSKLDSMHDKY